MAKKEKAYEPAEGNVVMLAPDGATSCSLEGVTYEVTDGTVEVPSSLSDDLKAHGYVAAE